jgi:hypothetical protein
MKSRICSSSRGRPGQQSSWQMSGGIPVHNELCERLGIEFPIFAFTHCRDVAAAVSNAGGIGVLGAVGFSAEELEVELTWLDEHVGDRPYGVDIVIPGKYEGMGELDPVKLEAELKGHDPRRAPDLRQEDPGRPRRARDRGWAPARAARAGPPPPAAPLVEVILATTRSLVANALGHAPRRRHRAGARARDADRRPGRFGQARAEPQGGRRRHRHLPGLRGRRPHRRRRAPSSCGPR